MNDSIPPTKYAISNDVGIAYQVWGDGPIDLVVVPPIVNHIEHLLELDEYVQFVRRLSSFARVIVFDKRGQGLSDFSDMACNSLETRMDDLRAVMDAAQSEQAVIMGCSEGGPISIMFAASHPNRVSSLVLYGTFAKFIRTEEYPRAPFDQHMFTGLLPTIMQKWGTGVMAGFLAPSFVGNPEKMNWLAKFERLSSSPGRFRTFIELNSSINVHPLLKTIYVPTLVLHKITDTGVSFDSSLVLNEDIGDSKLVELPGVNHLPYLDDTQLLAREIQAFLQDINGGMVSDSSTYENPTDKSRVLSTILFTDIVSSTQQANELGDTKWKKVLEIHNKTSKDLVKKFSGNYIKSTGDGLLATFDGPGRAINCAREMQSILSEAGIEIRAGLHTGEVEVLQGHDIGGISVHIASRIETKAKPGQILVSRTITELVAGSDIQFQEEGTHELKGISDNWQLYSVT